MAFKKTRAFRGNRPLTSVLDQIVRPVYAKRGFAHNRIITDWPKIVGPMLCNVTSPKKLSFYQEKHHEGVLEVEAYESGLAMELTYLEPMILERIATYFGYKAVGRLKIIQRPRMMGDLAGKAKSKPKKVSKENAAYINTLVSDIKDDEMREVLQSLGEAVSCKNKE